MAGLLLDEEANELSMNASFVEKIATNGKTFREDTG